MSNLAFRDAGSNEGVELPLEVGRLDVPKRLFSVRSGVAPDLYSDRATLRWIAIGKHCNSDALEGNR
jgi:hypothetical protein